MANDLTLEVKNLTKNFNGFLAVDDISFEIKKGEILGILGPNGAGKTTTIMMLLGITKPTSGQIRIFGLDSKTNRERIANRVNFSSAYISFSGRLTVWENLRVFSHLYGIKNPREKINKILRDFEVEDLKDKFTGNLSSGQLTRLSLCKALLNDPELLFLDEPTASLDPDIAKKVREFLLKLRKEKNASLLYTSHNMEEISQMCDRVIFLDKGKIVAADTPLNLTKMIEECVLILTFDAELSKVKNFCEKRNLNFQIPQSNTLEINLKEKEIGAVLTQLAREGIDISDIGIEKPRLEDVFLRIVNKNYQKI